MGLSSNNKTKIEGGMASMTDLVFLLLIFFIIMSLMSNSQVTVDLPEPSEKPPQEQTHVDPSVIITEDNMYVVMPGGSMDTPMAFDDIKELAASVVDESGKLKLKVAGHRKASYEAVFNVLALCQANGWDPVMAYK